MFRLLGTIITRYWPVALAAWVLLLVGSSYLAPGWDAAAQDGDVAFLSENAPSRRGDQLFQKAFPEQYAATSVVIVVARPEGPLLDQDEVFLQQALTPRLEKMAAERKDLVTRIRTMSERGSGALLVSPNRQATLVIVELSALFLDPRSGPVVEEVENVLRELEQKGDVPRGLSISVTGSATAGRDLMRAQVASVRAIEMWTIIAVVVLLALLYRAPLAALIPLVTVYVAVQISLNLLIMMNVAGVVTLSSDVRIFITVLAYGAGVDYCVFLIARYREELELGRPPGEAMANAIALVGGPIAASAGTVICGIGVLAFMEFGKVKEAGIVIPFALFIVLCGTLSFTSALLRLAGRWVFWPFRPAPPVPGQAAPSSWWRRVAAWNVWEKIGPVMLRWPGTIWLASVGAMLPFAIVAMAHYQDQSYNPIDDLPPSAPSVAGARALEKYFSPGILGAIQVFVEKDDIDFGTIKGIDLIGDLSDRLQERREELSLADIRSVARPLGTTAAAEEEEATSPLARSVMRTRAIRFYVSRTDQFKGHLTRLDLLLSHDPFSPGAISDLKKIEAAITAHLPRELHGARIFVAGTTVAIRDLGEVKARDQQRVEIFVPIVIFLLLWFVLRRVVVSIYLVASVLISYLATLGAAYLLFWWIVGDSFLGLDWKVPIFLFTILVAVGEDYNIFLTMRITEEQAVYGPLDGIIVALARTGRVISSCGFIMAGTFASLLSGSLLAIQELGFALSFGILLDTLVVRPILVPTFLILLEAHTGRLGRYFALSPSTGEQRGVLAPVSNTNHESTKDRKHEKGTE